MDHRGKGVFGGDAGEDAGQVVAVGGVAGDDLGIGAEGGEFLAQGVRSGGVGSAPAGEQQVPYAVTGDQVAGDVGAQDAGAAGDQDGAGRRFRRPRRRWWRAGGRRRGGRRAPGGAR